jgi:hypothetical protein
MAHRPPLYVFLELPGLGLNAIICFELSLNRIATGEKIYLPGSPCIRPDFSGLCMGRKSWRVNTGSPVAGGRGSGYDIGGHAILAVYPPISIEEVPCRGLSFYWE